MFRRLSAFLFLAVVLVCAGLGVPGQPAAAAAQGGQAMASAAADEACTHACAPGDEQRQLPGSGLEPMCPDALSDAPELVDATRLPDVPRLRPVPPSGFGLAALPPPFIEGPQRPPRDSALPA